MDVSLPERIQALVAQWRARGLTERGWTCEACVDELEALLASQASGWQSMELQRKEDGIFLFLTAPSGKKAAINLARHQNMIVQQVLEELAPPSRPGTQETPQVVEGCDCDQPDNPDLECHASDCEARRS